MLFEEFRETIRKDKTLRLLLLASLIVQVIVCLTAIGIYHPDQHFQIIEFSSAQLHKPFGYVWEYDAHIRPTLQVYIFTGYRLLCGWVGITDPFTQMELLQVVVGLALFVLYNAFALWYFKDGPRRTLYWVVFILNFSWWIPYTRTLFSSEMLSSLLFFGGVFIYITRRTGWLLTTLIGFMFALSFYARFQTAFAILGFGCWMIFFERRYMQLLPLAIGYILGVTLNTWMDHEFYHQWVITPYTYYKVNIIEGKAANFGTSPFIVYFIELMGIVFAPLISILLLWFAFRAAIIRKLSDPLSLPVLLFIVGHCIVAHKEDRFLFPILSIMPILVGWGLPDLLRWYETRRPRFHKWIKGIAVFSLSLDLVVLVLFMFTPYCQALHFAAQVKKAFNGAPVSIYTVPRSPLETDGHLPFMYYQEGTRNFSWNKLSTIDSLRYVTSGAEYITTTYNDVKDRKHLLDSLGYERKICSSQILWGLNTALQSVGINTINDVWVLYQKKK